MPSPSIPARFQNFPLQIFYCAADPHAQSSPAVFLKLTLFSILSFLLLLVWWCLLFSLKFSQDPRKFELITSIVIPKLPEKGIFSKLIEISPHRYDSKTSEESTWRNILQTNQFVTNALEIQKAVIGLKLFISHSNLYIGVKKWG